MIADPALACGYFMKVSLDSRGIQLSCCSAISSLFKRLPLPERIVSE